MCPRRKKSKNANKGPGAIQSGSFPYHPEEEFIDQVSFHIGFDHYLIPGGAKATTDCSVIQLGQVQTYPLKTAPARDAESFGVDQFGRLVKISRDGLGKAVEAMMEACR